MIKHVIFDCDGVLVDTEIVAANRVTAVLKNHGIDMSMEYYINNYTGKLLSDIYRKLLDLGEAEVKQLVHETDHAIYEDLVPINGMQEVVAQIPHNKSVVSNSALWQVKKALAVTSLTSYFNSQFSAEMVKNPKPAPDVYLLAAETNNVQPGECLVIEDSISGVQAAVSAGMKVIGFTGASHIREGHDLKLKEKGAIETASSPDQLLLTIRGFIDN